jgi:hypothetical protein
MAHAGIKTRFKLDNAAGALTDISTYLDSIQGSSDTEFLDGTTFQPDATTAVKNEIPGFATKGFSLSGKWTEAAEAFFSAIEGEQNLEYEYKPDDPNMNSSITGTCSCGSYSGPQSSVDGIITFTCELRVQSRSFNQGSAGSPE